MLNYHFYNNRFLAPVSGGWCFLLNTNNMKQEALINFYGAIILSHLMHDRIASIVLSLIALFWIIKYIVLAFKTPYKRFKTL